MIGNAVRVMRIATGEEADDAQDDGKSAAAKELGSKGGKKRAAVASKPGKRGPYKKSAAGISN
ncbi:RNA-binding protein [Mesorhizobium sp. M2A.F.Ca.ET.042.01.1.1]|uniref:RNA-binding protein n=1 Tax=Mesorhizobium sp. M2A.F.Ca.ET.042.01.1.1 TaxID=2496745 RepID=UPI001675A861|nr:RNA-binding protein [Mesorhizobium sp. M2A.F.Ca.ET.042.01.1.1]